MTQVVLLAFMLLFYSCIPGQESEVSVEGQSSIVNQVKIYSTQSKNIGDWSLETDPLEITLTIKNNSSKPITNISVTLVKKGQIDGLNFLPEEGLSTYPGLEGTCGSKLASGANCTIKLEFAPSQSGRLNYEVKFNYKNLIDDESQSLSFVALAGSPASLVFSNNQATYDLGLKEQVDDGVVKQYPLITKLVLQNKGELAARDIVPTITSSNEEPSAFSVSKYSCPEELKSEETCEIEIAYQPLNTGINDPETNYASNLSLKYEKDQAGKPATLASIFTAISAKIEGRFEKSGSQVLCFRPDEESPCGPITAGTSGLSFFKVINKGYQDAVLKKVVVAYEDMLVYCEVGGGENLLCYEAGKILKYNSGSDLWYLNGKDNTVPFPQAGYSCEVVETGITTHCVLNNIVKSQLPLMDFPFLLQDTDLCMTNQTRVEGTNILKIGGGVCEIGFKFHPPINFNKEGQQSDGEEILELPAEGAPEVEVSVIYDSLWKGDENIYINATAPLFRAEPKSVSQAVLRIKRFTFGSLSKEFEFGSGAGQFDFDETTYGYDLARYPMVLDNTISVPVRIIVRNYGNTRATFDSIYVEHNGGVVHIPFKDGDVNLGGKSSENISCDPSPEPFFRNMKSYCDQDELTGTTWLDPDDECEIRFNFTPVSETNKIRQNLCMFGLPTNDGRYNQTCIDDPATCNIINDNDKRKFFFVYQDGTEVEDDLKTPTTAKHVEFQFDATLSAAGKLQIGPLGGDADSIPKFTQNKLDIEETDPRFYGYGHIEVMNVGSGAVPYIFLEDGFNLDPFDYPIPSHQSLAFVESNLHPLIGTNNANGKPYKDCYYIIQNKPQDVAFGQFSNLFPVPVDETAKNNFITSLQNYQGNPDAPTLSLDTGESCILTVRAKSPYGLHDDKAVNNTSLETFATSPDYREFQLFLSAFPHSQESCNNTLETTRIDEKGVTFPEAEIKIYYYDSDTDTSYGATPENVNYGNKSYVYQDSDPFEIDSSEGRVSATYPVLRDTPINSVLWVSPKEYPGIDSSPLFSTEAQLTSPIFYFGKSGSKSGTYYSWNNSQAFFKNTRATVEELAGVDFNTYDQVLSFGAIANNNNEPYSFSIDIIRELVPTDFISMTYTPLYSEGTDEHKIVPTLSTTDSIQRFQIDTTPDATGFHIGELEYSYKTNMKVETSRLANPCDNYTGDISKNGDSDSNFVMLDIDNAAKFDYVTVTKKVLVYAKVYQPADTPHISVNMQKYAVCYDGSYNPVEDDPYDLGDDGVCNGKDTVGAETSHRTFYFNMANSNTGVIDDDKPILEDIKLDDLYTKYRIKINNTSAHDLIFAGSLGVTISGSAGSADVATGESVFSGTTNQYNKLDYGLVNSGAANHSPALQACTGTLPAGDSCAMFISLKANGALQSTVDRWVTLQYYLDGDQTKIVEKFPIQLKPLDPAQIIVEGFGTPVSTIGDTSDDVNFAVSNAVTSRFKDEDYEGEWNQGNTTDAIKLPMGSITINQAPTEFQFHLKLTADSGLLSAYIRQELFNKTTEGTDWDPADYHPDGEPSKNKVSSVNNKSRMVIDYDPISPVYPGEQSCADFQAGDAGLDNGDSCVIVISYFIDESFVNSDDDNITGHEGIYLDYCNNYQGSNPEVCSTERLYFTFTGDVKFANAGTVSGSDLVFDNIEAADNGVAYFDWDEVTTNANWSNFIVDYILKYGSTEKKLSVLEVQGNASINQRWVRMTGLIPGNFYDVELIPIVDSQYSTETYKVAFNQGQQKVKFLVPDDNLIYFHDQALLVKVIDDKNNYVNIEDECSDRIKVGSSNDPMQVMSTTQYNLLRGLNFANISPFEAYWTSQTDAVDLLPSAEVECLFPHPSIVQNENFADSPVKMMIGDSESAGYKNDSSHADCNDDILWIPEYFTGSSLLANGICTYEVPGL